MKVIDEKPKYKPDKGVTTKIRLVTIGFLLLLISVILFVGLILLTSVGDPFIDWNGTATTIVSTNNRVATEWIATSVRLQETATLMGLDASQYRATQIAQTRTTIAQGTMLPSTQTAAVTITP